MVPLNRILRVPRDRCMGKWGCLKYMLTSSPSLQYGLLYQSRILPDPFLLNRPQRSVSYSTLLANPLQIDLEPSAADPTDTIRIVRGRTLNSKNLLYCGFRYVKDENSLTITRRQPWRCVIKTPKLLPCHANC